MTKIDEVVERECNHVGYTSKCYSPRELRALLQEVHDAAVAECGKDAKKLRIAMNFVNYWRNTTTSCCDEEDMEEIMSNCVELADAAIAAAKVE